jgi:hypothetical protein
MSKIELDILRLRKLIEKDRQRLIGLKDQKMVAIIKRVQKKNIASLNKLLSEI